MRNVTRVGLGLLGLVVVGGYLDHRHHAAERSTAVSATVPSTVAMKPSPIRPDWILEGSPVTEAAEIARTDDGSTQVFVWQTTAGRFNWHYGSDEIVTVLDGEVFVADADGSTRRLGPGDVAHFPVGASTTWYVPDHVRKIAVLKRPLPGPVASAMRWLRSVKDLVSPNSAFAG